ncbi:hypothetical protein NOVO_00145 [Rickettsiales bacterium Ac37b]|nr:hypothetical protein NOVO_00145 [Rickettsiales bacterium Ac37b]
MNKTQKAEETANALREENAALKNRKYLMQQFKTSEYESGHEADSEIVIMN